MCALYVLYVLTFSFNRYGNFLILLLFVVIIESLPASTSLVQMNLSTNIENFNMQFAANGLSTLVEGSFCRRRFDGRSGYCILATHCLHAMRDYRIYNISIDTCTYRKNIPVICCPLSEKYSVGQRVSAQKCYDYQNALKNIDISQPRTFSSKQCVSSVPMIVGGRSTQYDEYPHMVALGWKQRHKNETIWGCGGTLISENFVLTAAHCTEFQDSPPNIVRVGMHNVNKVTPHQRDIPILVIILHPKYNINFYYHDIALLKLSRSVEFSDLVRPACLWQLPYLNINSVTAAGWGRTSFMGSKSNDLQKVDLNIIDQSICANVYGKERRLPYGLTDAQFCAGHMAGGKDTCQGDSGGPLYAELLEYNCVKFIVGITSFGKFCAAPNAPGVYTKIYPYLDWIESIVFVNKSVL